VLVNIALGLCACVMLLLAVEVWHLHRVVTSLQQAVRGLGVESVRRVSAPHHHVWEADPVSSEMTGGKHIGVYRCLTCSDHGRFEVGKQPTA
jgi:hypothetical protein